MIPGPKEFLIGASGSGKTHALRTLQPNGVTPFVIFTEPGMEILGDIPDEQLHWRYIAPARQSWNSMVETANNINTLSFESLTKLSDANRRDYNQFSEVLRACNAFKCDRCGKEFGDVSKWGTDRALVLDSLSGLNIMAMQLVTGGKPVRNQAEWGVAQNNLEMVIQKLCMDLQCMFVLIGHLERETDEVSGGVKLMASTLGKKLAPKLPRFFSDVIMSVNEAGKFSWSTAAMGADLKARNLPWQDGLKPDFTQIIKAWQKRGGIIAPAAQG